MDAVLREQEKVVFELQRKAMDYTKPSSIQGILVALDEALGQYVALKREARRPEIAGRCTDALKSVYCTCGPNETCGECPPRLPELCCLRRAELSI